ncbi:MAG: DUF805 domain-containing protein [Saprospiraceae bacterium]|nr:DUF805 domain-containing protein [Saprospiraceae bacterium]
MFKKPFSFSGRIGRTEFVLSAMILAIFVWVFLDTIEDGEAIWMYFALAILLWFKLAQGTKRCHDMGCSGWHQLIPLFDILMLVSEGEEGANEYNEVPKGRMAHQEALSKGVDRRKIKK